MWFFCINVQIKSLYIGIAFIALNAIDSGDQMRQNERHCCRQQLSSFAFPQLAVFRTNVIRIYTNVHDVALKRMLNANTMLLLEVVTGILNPMLARTLTLGYIV